MKVDRRAFGGRAAAVANLADACAWVVAFSLPLYPETTQQIKYFPNLVCVTPAWIITDLIDCIFRRFDRKHHILTVAFGAEYAGKYRGRKQSSERDEKHARVELCQAQVKLGLFE